MICKHFRNFNDKHFTVLIPSHKNDFIITAGLIMHPTTVLLLESLYILVKKKRALS